MISNYHDSNCGSGPGADPVPMALGTALGLRTFRVDAQGWLRGITYQQRWVPGENKAMCLRTARTKLPVAQRGGHIQLHTGMGWPDAQADGSVPEEPVMWQGYQLAPCGGLEPDCYCGFYAYFTDEYPLYGTGMDAGVTGIIESYGRVVVGQRGYRAEKARIVALVLPDAKLASQYSLALDKAQTAWDVLDRQVQTLQLSRWHLGRNPRLLVGTVASLLAVAAAAPALTATALLAAGFGASLAVLSEYVDRTFVGAVRAELRAALDRAAGTLKELHAKARSINELRALVRRNYPGAEVYDTVSEMLAAHPLVDLGYLAREAPGEGQ